MHHRSAPTWTHAHAGTRTEKKAKYDGAARVSVRTHTLGFGTPHTPVLPPTRSCTLAIGTVASASRCRTQGTEAPRSDPQLACFTHHT